MSAETGLTVGELSNAIGISPDTVRYYANEGLLHPKQSAENGYWYYSSDDTVRLTDILFYRSMGLSIKEIKEIINNLPLDRIGRVIGSRKKELIICIPCKNGMINTKRKCEIYINAILEKCL